MARGRKRKGKSKAPRGQRAQTCGHRWLELVAGELTPADGVDVWGLAVHPLVVLAVPAIEVDARGAGAPPGFTVAADEPGAPSGPRPPASCPP